MHAWYKVYLSIFLPLALSVSLFFLGSLSFRDTIHPPCCTFLSTDQTPVIFWDWRWSCGLPQHVLQRTWCSRLTVRPRISETPLTPVIFWDSWRGDDASATRIHLFFLLKLYHPGLVCFAEVCSGCCSRATVLGIEPQRRTEVISMLGTNPPAHRANLQPWIIVKLKSKLTSLLRLEVRHGVLWVLFCALRLHNTSCCLGRERALQSIRRAAVPFPCVLSSLHIAHTFLSITLLEFLPWLTARRVLCKCFIIDLLAAANYHTTSIHLVEMSEGLLASYSYSSWTYSISIWSSGSI